MEENKKNRFEGMNISKITLEDIKKMSAEEKVDYYAERNKRLGIVIDYDEVNKNIEASRNLTEEELIEQGNNILAEARKDKANLNKTKIPNIFIIAPLMLLLGFILTKLSHYTIYTFIEKSMDYNPWILIATIALIMICLAVGLINALNKQYQSAPFKKLWFETMLKQLGILLAILFIGIMAFGIPIFYAFHKL